MGNSETWPQKVLRCAAISLAVSCGLVLLVVLVHIFQRAGETLISGGEKSTRSLVETVLDGFVLIELFRSFIDYVESHRLHLSLLLETALVFVLREMASGLYLGHVHLGTMLGYAVLIPVLLLSRKIACQQDRE